MSNEVDKLATCIENILGGKGQAQLRFATCTSVDWEARTMEAKGVVDELPYYSVMLGFGFVDVKPKVGSVCLLGVIEGKDSYTFMINAEDVEEVEIKTEHLIINDGAHKGIVKVSNLVDELNAIQRDLNSLKTSIKSWIPVPKDGGASLKSLISSWFGMNVKETKVEDLENDKIKH